jgi:hypothetical protein
MASTENEDEISLSLPQILSEIEKKFNDEKELDMKSVDLLFHELKKYQNGEKAIKEFKWIFGLGEEEFHVVDAKECRKVFLINFKKCGRFLQSFLMDAVKLE